MLPQLVVSEHLGKRLNFHLLNGGLLFTVVGVDIITLPYTIINGIANLSCLGYFYAVFVNNRVGAA